MSPHTIHGSYPEVDPRLGNQREKNLASGFKGG
jgi:hypothetical protein